MSPAVLISLLAAVQPPAPLLAVLEFHNDVPGIDRSSDRAGNYLADVARNAVAARNLRVPPRHGTVGTHLCQDAFDILRVDGLFHFAQNLQESLAVFLV